MRKPRGQILPLTLAIFPVVVLILVLSLERLQLANGKIEMQREADTLAILVATEQSRALNGIATLNDVLEVMQNRVGMYKVARAAVAVCSTFTPYCWKTLLLLEENWHRRFKPSVEKFGENVKKAQDELKEWAELGPQRIIQAYNLQEASLTIRDLGEEGKSLPRRWAFLYPHQEEREIERSLTLHIARADEVPEGEYDEAVRCSSPRPFRRWASFERARREGVFVFEPPSNDLRVHYEPLGDSSGSGFTRRIKSRPELNALNTTISSEGIRYTFRKASYRRCIRASNWMASSLLPKPYIATALFPDHQKIAIVLMSFPLPSLFGRLLKVAGLENRVRNANWAISEVEIPLKNLNKMEFRPKIRPVSMHEEAFASISERLPGISIMGEVRDSLKSFAEIDAPSLPIPGGEILGFLNDVLGIDLSISMPSIEFPHFEDVLDFVPSEFRFDKINLPKKEEYETALHH